jgi:hypothetical protein
MTTYLMPDAERILDLALAKAEDLIREGRLTDAIRTLAVAVAAADLVHDAELDDPSQPWWDDLDDPDGPTP